MKTYIPFNGFYDSIHSDNIDNWIEDRFDDEDYPDQKVYTDYEDINWNKTHIEYSKSYVNALNSIMDLNLKYITMDSPQYYNYETDKILCEITLKEVKHIFQSVDKDILTDVCKDLFTSRDGFHSFYNPEWLTWRKVEKWDQWQLYALLTAYCYEQYESIDHECAEYVQANGIDIIEA